MAMAVRISYFILILILTFAQYSKGQIISEEKLTDVPFVSVLQHSDNELIYVGNKRDPDSYKNYITLIKKDLKGDIIWERNIEWEFDCTVEDAQILPDRNIIIAGGARTSFYQSNPFILKTDPDGETLWSRFYQSGNQADHIISTSDGGYLFAYFDNGSGLMKLDADGDSIWSSRIGNGKPYGLAETSEAVYLMVDDEDDNIVLSSIGSSGEILWKRTFGGDGIDRPADVINAFNGDDYLFAGNSYSEDTGDDFYIGLLDCFGYVNWTKTFGGKGTDLCYDLMQSSDGDFIAVGSSNSFNEDGRFDFYIVKFDTYGNIIWEKTFPGSGNEEYLAQNVFETSYGSFLIAGPKLSGSAPTGDFYLVEFIYPTQFELSFESDKQTVTNPPFEVKFTNNTSDPQYYDFVWHFGDGESLESNDNIVFHEYKENGFFDVKLVAYENDFGSVDSLVYENYINISGISTSIQDIEAFKTSEILIQPNPFSRHTVISFNNPDNYNYTLRIIDQNGKVVRKIDNLRGQSLELSRDGLPSGIYFIELTGKKTSRAKLLIE